MLVASNFVIPYGQSAIERNAFHGHREIESLTIPGTVKIIKSNAFAECVNLTSLTISPGVTSIREYVFSGCTSLESVVIPDSVEFIGEQAFERCKKLRNIYLSNSLTHIEAATFAGCEALESIVIPSSVKSIAVGAFRDCFALAFFEVEPSCEIPFGAAPPRSGRRISPADARQERAKAMVEARASDGVEVVGMQVPGQRPPTLIPTALLSGERQC